jgi:hypothetical protein
MIEDRLISDIPTKYAGTTPEDVQLGHLRYAKSTPYNVEIVEDTHNWMSHQDLITDTACSTDLVDNRIAEPTTADDCPD